MVFKPSQKRKSHDIQLLIKDFKLDQVKETIFLGVILDENLNWKSEISRGDLINISFIVSFGSPRHC